LYISHYDGLVKVQIRSYGTNGVQFQFGSIPNAFIIQGDILAMPFREKSFDFIFSEGVLHHTPNPHEAFH